MTKGSCCEPLGEALMGFPVGTLSDRPLRVICRSHSSLTSAKRVVHEIAIAMIGDAGSTTVIIIAFALERILSWICLVNCGGLLVCGMRVSVHAALCHGGQLFSEHAREPKARNFVPPFSQSTGPGGDCG